VLSCFFQQRDYLFPLHTGKSFEELLDRIARFQMIEETLYRDARPGKNRFATEDLRILGNNAAHEQNYALETQSIQANITCLPSRLACHAEIQMKAGPAIASATAEAKRRLVAAE
jgi:serine phosphatase RsbU (regulator of sigma subunit)